MTRLTKIICGLGALLTLHANADVREGFYLGAGAEAAFDSYHFNTVNLDNQNALDIYPSRTRALGNVFLGYGHTFKVPVYLGLELGTDFPKRSAEFSRPGVTLSSYTFSDKLSIQDYVSGDFLLGYRVIKPILLYARLGTTFSQLTIKQYEHVEAGVPESTFKDNKWSGRFGAGINFGITKHLGLGIDYFYTLYPKMDATLPLFNQSLSQKPHSQTVGISFIYSFK